MSSQHEVWNWDARRVRLGPLDPLVEIEVVLIDLVGMPPQNVGVDDVVPDAEFTRQLVRTP